MLKTNKACEKLGIHPNTLRRWAKEGKISCVRQKGGNRLYDVESFLNREEKCDRAKFIYTRVSSRNQQDDLSNQIRYLRERYPHHKLIEDIGSGLNFKRKGFLNLLDRIMSRDVEEVVVAHRDRLCRFGFELVEWFFTKHNVKLMVLDNSKSSPQQELVTDLLSIITVFSCRIHGLRKYSETLKKDKILSNETTENSSV
ncbi:MAG: IS607 family transposase [Candidatus Riflebacteria bacterium]|nr:IS607 family transposase [Candidatus Riflebacteria bacterium]